MSQLLTHDDVADLLSIERSIDSVEAALRSIDDYQIPERIQMKEIGRGGEIFVMPGHDEQDAIVGVKVVNIFPANDERDLPATLGAIQLYDGETGALDAVLDGSRITNYRTGAIGGVAARYLAPPTSRTVGIFGSSTQARHQALALDAELDLNRIRFYSRSSKREEAVAALEGSVSATLEATETPTEAARDAQILVAATTATSPVIPPEVITPGTLVIGVGSNDPTMREIPGKAMASAEHVFVDDYEHCLRVGDLADAIAEDQLSKADVHPLGDLGSNAVAGRTASDEVFVVKSVGSIAFDIRVARDVLKWSQETDVGTTVDLQGLDRERDA
jgi:alanine dehydrogenase